MDPEHAKDYVEILLDYQFNLLWRRGVWGVNHAEFLFVQASITLTEHPALRAWFVELVRSNALNQVVIDGRRTPRPPGYVPREFVTYFVHWSRWDEFGEIASELRGTKDDPWRDNPAITWSAELSSALTDEWEDREFYSRFPNHAA